MKKLLTGMFACACALMNGQTNVQEPVRHEVFNFTTSANPDDYVFEETGKMQVVRLYIVPSTDPHPAQIYVQKGNSVIDFCTDGPIGFDLTNAMSYLSVQWDGGEKVEQFHNDGLKLSWVIYTPNLSLGTHDLHIEYVYADPAKNGEVFTRDYKVTYVEPCSKYYQVQTHDGAKMPMSNSITLWEKPDAVGLQVPVLVVEGFNPTNTLFAEFYRYQSRNMVAKGMENGLKYYFLNLGVNGQDMRNNAAVLEAAIKFVSSLNSLQKVVVLGVNSGAVIARYCLAKNEHDNKLIGSTNYLPVSNFISMDGPHQGLVVSDELLDFIKKKSDNAEKEIDKDVTFSSMLGKQLIRKDNPFRHGDEFNKFFNELDSLNGNGYPSFTENVAVALSGDTQSR